MILLFVGEKLADGGGVFDELFAELFGCVKATFRAQVADESDCDFFFVEVAFEVEDVSFDRGFGGGGGVGDGGAIADVDHGLATLAVGGDDDGGVDSGLRNQQVTVGDADVGCREAELSTEFPPFDDDAAQGVGVAQGFGCFFGTAVEEESADCR